MYGRPLYKRKKAERGQTQNGVRSFYATILCNSVKDYEQSVVDHALFNKNSWFNYYIKSDVADKALAYALNETLPKPR